MKKNLFMVAMTLTTVAMLSVGFSSCGHHDPDEMKTIDTPEKTDSIEGGGGVIDGKDKAARLTSVVSEKGVSYFDLSYDAQNRVTYFGFEWDEETYKISYDPFVIKEYEGEELILTHTVTTDSYGRVVNIAAKGVEYENYGTDSYVDTYSYDNNGYLVKIIRVYEYGGETTMQLTWENGNMISLSWADKFQTDFGDATIYGKATNTYSDKMCPANPIALGLWYAYAGLTMEAFSGKFGKVCKNLPSKVVLSGHTDYPENYPEEYRFDENEDDEIVTLSYTLNTNGTVAKEQYTDNYTDEDGNQQTDSATLIYNYDTAPSKVNNKVAARHHASHIARMLARKQMMKHKLFMK